MLLKNGGKALLAGLALSLAISSGAEKHDKNSGPVTPQKLAKEVRHELVLLPYYGVFDNLAFKIDGSTVTLLGQVTRPTLKSDAERVVKDIQGVERVVNNLEVLPLSPNDDRIRRAVYAAIYSKPGLDRYSLQAVPPIHIIVRNGNVTLEGVVASDADRNLANISANGVPGVFGVTNHLVTDKEIQGAR